MAVCHDRDVADLDTRTLGSAFSAFMKASQPWGVIVTLAITSTLRAVFGGPLTWRDAVVVATLVALNPFMEWVLHVFVLHAKPFHVGKREIDMFAAVEHRRHHAEPRDAYGSLAPPRVALEVTVLSVLLAAAWPTWGMRLTALVTYGVLGGIYEWTHFLIHCDYKPKGAYYRRLWVHHRLHHFRNENYWFGVTRTLGDTVLHTKPEKDDVPTSATVKDILAAA